MELSRKERVVDRELKRLIDELSTAIGNSISGSEEVGKVVAKIKSDGYDLVMVLNASIAIKERETAPSTPLNRADDSGGCRFNSDDLRFLRELHIRINE
ncbi:MAG: hypothetical protein ACM3JB_12115 [Acidobacteriaceae bacterium]